MTSTQFSLIHQTLEADFRQTTDRIKADQRLQKPTDDRDMQRLEDIIAAMSAFSTLFESTLTEKAPVTP